MSGLWFMVYGLWFMVYGLCKQKPDIYRCTCSSRDRLGFIQRFRLGKGDKLKVSQGGGFAVLKLFGDGSSVILNYTPTRSWPDI